MHQKPPLADLTELARKACSPYSAAEIKSVFRNPVIVVSAPRSGSTLLFEQLARVPAFWTIGGESHVIFRALPHLQAENSKFDSGRLGLNHADKKTRHVVRSCFLYMLRNSRGAPYLTRPGFQELLPVCLLEKTPRNALNIPFLLKVFPEARFIYLYRDPRQVVASLIEAWTRGLRTGRFVTYQELPGWDRPGWCFLLPPGWQEMRGKSLAEIAAFQWSASNRIIVNELGLLPAKRWTAATYAEMINDPDGVLTRLGQFAGVVGHDSQMKFGPLALSRTVITPPHPDKWKNHEAEIAAFWPALSETLEQIDKFCSFNGAMA